MAHPSRDIVESDDSNVSDSDPDLSGSNSDEAHGFLDTEALEDSDGRDSDEQEEEDEDEDTFASPYCSSFPRFGRLPVELRQRVWEFFCPDLTAKSRVFEFYFDVENPPYVKNGIYLDQQTAAARAMQAVHSESRALALRKFPDILPFHGGELRFRSETDIICTLEMDFQNGHPDIETTSPVPEFCAKVNNLALDLLNRDVLTPIVQDEAAFAQVSTWFPHLETLYIVFEDEELSTKSLVWCGSPLLNKYLVLMHEDISGIPHPVSALFCWPDLAMNRDFAEQEVRLDPDENGFISAAREYAAAATAARLESTDLPRIAVWPMIRFSFQTGLRRLEKLELPGVVIGDTSDESDGETSSSQYADSELEGFIDDGNDLENDSASDEDDLAVQALSDDEQADDLPAPANFSSPEPESGTVGGDSSDSDAASDAAPVSRPKASRRRVISSDSEETASTDRVRPAARRTRIVLSDSESEDGVAQEKPHESDKQSKSSGHESLDEESDDDGARPARPLSLAERLRLHRDENSVSSSESESEADMDGGDYTSWAHDDDNDGSEDGESGNEGEGRHADRGGTSADETEEDEQ